MTEDEARAILQAKLDEMTDEEDVAEALRRLAPPAAQIRVEIVVRPLQ